MPQKNRGIFATSVLARVDQRRPGWPSFDSGSPGARAHPSTPTPRVHRHIEFSGIVHPLDLDESHLQRFLDFLVSERKVSASTHQQALCAIVFLYRQVLEVDMPWIEGLVRPKHVAPIPVVMTKEETRQVLEKLDGVHLLAASLLYGSGLRLRECLRLRNAMEVAMGFSRDASIPCRRDR